MQLMLSMHVLLGKCIIIIHPYTAIMVPLHDDADLLLLSIMLTTFSACCNSMHKHADYNNYDHTSGKFGGWKISCSSRFSLI